MGSNFNIFKVCSMGPNFKFLKVYSVGSNFKLFEVYSMGSCAIVRRDCGLIWYVSPYVRRWESMSESRCVLIFVRRLEIGNEGSIKNNFGWLRDNVRLDITKFQKIL